MTIQEIKLLSGTMKAWEKAKESRKKGERDREEHARNIVEVDAAHRQTAPTGHCLLCLRWPIVLVPINLLASCARAGKDGWI